MSVIGLEIGRSAPPWYAKKKAVASGCRLAREFSTEGPLKELLASTLSGTSSKGTWVVVLKVRADSADSADSAASGCEWVFEWFENECMTLIYVIKRTYIIKFEEFLNFTQKVMIVILNHLHRKDIALRFYLNRANAKIKPKP